MHRIARSALVVVAIAVLSIFTAVPAAAVTTVDVLGADRIEGGAAVEATVSVTCDPLPPGDSFAALFLTIFQGKSSTPNHREGQGGVGLEGVNGLICDTTPHSYTFPVRLTSFFSDKKFTPGPAMFEWSVSVCTRIDPETTVCNPAGGPTQGPVKITP
jgi:hypothetical protein